MEKSEWVPWLPGAYWSRTQGRPIGTHVVSKKNGRGVRQGGHKERSYYGRDISAFQEESCKANR